MDFYFWTELIVPLIFAVVLYRIELPVLAKIHRFRAVFKIAVSLANLFAIFIVYGLLVRYFNQIQCEAAYGPLAADPEMCDNPAKGILMLFFQMPVLLVFWGFLSGLLAIKTTEPKSA